MKKLRKQARELLNSAAKVYHYRRDLLPEHRLIELDKAVNDVNARLADDPDNRKPLEAAMERLDALLCKIGGKIYPKTFWSDNLEVALVATIIVIGVRTFFFQPFIIPTNSMYPTYSGMRTEVYTPEETGPGVLGQLTRTLTLGARHYEATAPSEGEVRIPFFSHDKYSDDRMLLGDGRVRFKFVDGRKWFGLLPARKREYTLFVDDRPVKIRIPESSNLDSVIRETFFPNAPSLKSVIESSFENRETNFLAENPILDTGHTVEPGDPLVKFDITLGDALFVDRISYHFVRPKPGDPFVFRTGQIPGVEGGPDNFVDKYYIKRLAGVGGETLEIRNNTLYADGEPRDEAEAFVKNARQVDGYNGYKNLDDHYLTEGTALEIPEDKFVALGDNSSNSKDSRYWGFVPEKAVVGKAFFIYYPFTKRWGLAE
ncbi:MAG: signal peptidase I [Opitutales bacterium]